MWSWYRVAREKACCVYVRISDATPRSRRRANARRATAAAPTSRWSETSPWPRRCRLPAVWKSAESSASRSQRRTGAIAASSLRTSSESDILELQEPALVPAAERAVRAEPVCGHHPVARNEDRQPVAGTEGAGRTLGVRV